MCSAVRIDVEWTGLRYSTVGAQFMTSLCTDGTAVGVEKGGKRRT